MRNEQQTRRLAILSSATAQRVGLKQTYATMRKSALIATCLTQTAMVPDVNAGEAAVRQASINTAWPRPTLLETKAARTAH